MNASFFYQTIPMSLLFIQLFILRKALHTNTELHNKTKYNTLREKKNKFFHIFTILFHYFSLRNTNKQKAIHYVKSNLSFRIKSDVNF